LQKLLREQVVDDETLMTLFAEVERVLNDRPLWSPSDDVQDESPLTPNNLLLLHRNACLPFGMFAEEDNSVQRRWKQANYLANVFWRRWLRQYLPTLQHRRKWSSREDNRKKGT
jgi:hypothetical protein